MLLKVRVGPLRITTFCPIRPSESVPGYIRSQRIGESISIRALAEEYQSEPLMAIVDSRAKGESAPSHIQSPFVVLGWR